MATDWAADVKKYVAKADDAAIAGIVRYCGIALRNRDSALVSFSDKAETDLVRNNFLKKKLGLTQADSALDAAIAKVAGQMKADRTKNRVTVYYLLASEFKQLGQFVKAAPVAKKAPANKAAAPVKAAAVKAAPKPATKAVGAAAVAAGVVAAAKTKPAKAAPAKKVAAPAKKAAAPAKKAAAPAKATTAKAAAPANNATQGLLDKAATTASDAGKAAPKPAASAAAGTVAAAGAADTAASAVSSVADKASSMMSASTKPASASTAADDGSEMNWLWWAIGILVVAFLLWFMFLRGPDADDANGIEAAASAAASDVGTDLAAAQPEGNAPIPAGAGVTSEMRDGKPVVKVYFDTGITDVTPDFAKTAGGLKSWLDTHSGSTLAVSGYSDPSGNAAANADLAKQRAQAVQSALVTAGIPATTAMLVKPEVSADATVPKEAARRVEVVVK